MDYLKRANFGRRRPIGRRSISYRAIAARVEVLDATARLALSGTAFDPELERSWAAGFFDAEGSTYNRRTSDRLGEVLKIICKVGQSTEDGSIADVLPRFARAVGRGYISGPYWDRGRLPHHVWSIQAFAGVVEVHEALCPVLSPVKREQAHRAIAAFVQYRAGRPKGAGRLRRARCA